MKISARNMPEGSVVSTARDATTAHLRLDVGGAIVSSAATNGSADKLNFIIDQTAYAVVKASDVMIAVE